MIQSYTVRIVIVCVIEAHIQLCARQMHHDFLQLLNYNTFSKIILNGRTRAKIMTLLLMSEVTRSKFVTHFFNSMVKIKHFPFFLFVHFTCFSCLGSSCPDSCLQFLVLPFDFVFCKPFCNNFEYLLNPLLLREIIQYLLRPFSLIPHYSGPLILLRNIYSIQACFSVKWLHVLQYICPLYSIFTLDFQLQINISI